MKESAFSTCVGWALRFAPRTETFCVFDLNAGPGENRRNGANCRGTPLLMIDKLKEAHQPAEIWLCDKRKTTIAELRPKVVQNDTLFGPSSVQVHLVHADNAEFVRTIPGRILKSGLSLGTCGVIIADPDGLDVPLAALAEIMPMLPRIDMAIHLCAFKQVWADQRRNRQHGGPFTLKRAVPSLSAIFAAIPKRSWLVSEPYGEGFTRGHLVMYGSNLKHLPNVDGKPGRPNMWRIDSDRGRQLRQAIEVAA